MLKWAPLIIVGAFVVCLVLTVLIGETIAALKFDDATDFQYESDD